MLGALCLVGCNESIRRFPLRDPLWVDAGLAKDVQQGRYLLPRSATGLRETIITSPIARTTPTTSRAW